MAVAGKEVLVEAFVAQASVETLHEAVLHWLARRDVMPLDSMVLLPFEDGVRGQLGSVIRHDHAGIARAERDPVQFTADTLAGKRVVDHGGKALATEVIEDAKDTKAPAVDRKRPANAFSGVERWNL